MIKEDFLKFSGNVEQIKRSSATVNYVVEQALEHFSSGKNIAIILDIDKTLVFHTPQDGMLSIAPDAYCPPGTKETIIKLQGFDGVTCFGISGRSSHFMREHFNLNGSGQFHAEMHTVFSGEHHCLKPSMNLSDLEPILRKAVEDEGGYLEDDKSHHLCAMCEITDDFLGKALGIVNNHNKTHDSKLVAEYGDDFFEVGPVQTCKGDAFHELVSHDSEFFENCFPIYCGDTPDKDGPVMKIVNSMGGVSVGVGTRFEGSTEFLHVSSPTGVYKILSEVDEALSQKLNPPSLQVVNS